MSESNSNQILLDSYINLLWKEFNEIRKKHTIAPLILSFSIVEASARLAAPEELETTKSRFIWWVDEFLKNKDGLPYSSIDLYGARCGLFHEYGAESDMSRRAECRVIVWVTGTDSASYHNKSGNNMLVLSKEEFFNDLYNGGIRMLEKLKTDIPMSVRFSSRLPKIFGIH
jgi:hypothetical protein